MDSRVDFVITAPIGYGASLAYNANARTTLGVLVQLISQAEHSLVIAAPFFQPEELVEKGVIAASLIGALRRGVNVDLASSVSGIEAIKRERLRREARGRIRFFQPAANIEDARRLGSHAKFYIADRRIAYLGSANFTSPGLGSHLEMGVLLDGSIANQVHQFWEHLLQDHFFIETT